MTPELVHFVLLLAALAWLAWLQRCVRRDKADVMANCAPALETVDLINQLRADEGDSVEIVHDNPDFDGRPNCLIVVRWIGEGGEPRERAFQGDTVLDCLRDAALARHV